MNFLEDVLLSVCKRAFIACAVIFVVAKVALYSAGAHAQVFGSSTPSQPGVGMFANSEAIRQGTVLNGTIIGVRPVKVEASGTKQFASVGAGSAIGGLLASRVGNGNGKIAASVVGTFLGGIVGQQIANAALGTDALELIVQTTDNRALVVIQAPDGLNFGVGMPCFIVSTNGNTRVVPVNAAQYVSKTSKNATMPVSLDPSAHSNGAYYPQ